MNIRKLGAKERFDAYLISAFCFHNRIEDVEAEREKAEAETVEDWGAFSEDGTLMARIINNKYEFNIDGKPVSAGGIGGVSTLPEYRESGAVKEIFGSLLKEAYKNGEVISCLYPFSHSFYRKQGYETVVFANSYEFPPEALRGYRFDGQVKMWKPGESVKEYLEVYNEFIKGFNFAMTRTEENMAEHMKVDKLYMDRKFSYLFSKNGKNIAYITFVDVRHDPMAILDVKECGWVNADGFNALLAFLSRFDADYGTVKLTLPVGYDLIKIVRSNKTYDIKTKSCFAFMVRVINAKKLLEVIDKPVNSDFTIKVTDEKIEENNRIFKVTGENVVETDSDFDIEVSERMLGQLATGAISLDEAMLKPDVKVYGKQDMLSQVFRQKKIGVFEQF